MTDYQTIITKHGVTAGVVPSGLTNGELAVNIADAILFVGGTAGNAIPIVSGGGGGGGVSGPYVVSLNGLTGPIGLSAGSNVSISVSGKTLTISSSGGGGGVGGFTYSDTPPVSPTIGYRWIDSDTGKEYVWVSDGSSDQWIQPMIDSVVGATGATGATGPKGETGPVGNYVESFNGATGVVSFVNFVSSLNGSTGAVTNVARTNQGNTFSVRQVMNAGITTANLFVSGGATFNGTINLTDAVVPTIIGRNSTGILNIVAEANPPLFFPAQPTIFMQDGNNAGFISINPNPNDDGGSVSIGNSNCTTTIMGGVTLEGLVSLSSNLRFSDGTTQSSAWKSNFSGGKLSPADGNLVAQIDGFISSGIANNCAFGPTGTFMMTLSPFTFNRGCTLSTLYTFQNSDAGNTGSFKFVVYAPSQSTGLPFTRMYESSVINITPSTGTTHVVSPNIRLEPGTYWIGALFGIPSGKTLNTDRYNWSAVGGVAGLWTAVNGGRFFNVGDFCSVKYRMEGMTADNPLTHGFTSSIAFASNPSPSIGFGTSETASGNRTVWVGASIT